MRLSSGSPSPLPPRHGEDDGGCDHTDDHRQRVVGHDTGLEPPQRPAAAQDRAGDAVHDGVHTGEIIHSPTRAAPCRKGSATVSDTSLTARS